MFRKKFVKHKNMELIACLMNCVIGAVAMYLLC